MAPTRRGVMGGLVSMGACAALGVNARALLAQTQISIPSEPMILTRVLQRSLRGGADLTVQRSWQVEFARQDQGRGSMTAAGITITGTQSDVSVDAPEVLSRLADIEAARSTDAMWPIALTDNGRIVSAGAGTRPEDLAEAIAEAERMISQRAISEDERAVHQRYLREMQRVSGSVLDRLPDDLFYPSGGPQRSMRELELPGGVIGQFEVTYDARCAAGCAWLGSAERKITTRIGQSEQRATEQWSLVNL